MKTDIELWHGSAAPHRQLEGGRDGGIHLGTRAQAASIRGRAPFLHRVIFSFDERRSVRGRDEGGWWSDPVERAIEMGLEAIVYLNRYDGFTPEDSARRRALEERAGAGGLPDAVIRQAFPQAEDSMIALMPHAVRVVEILSTDHPVTLGAWMCEEDAAAAITECLLPAEAGFFRDGLVRGVEHMPGCDCLVAISAPASALDADGKLADRILAESAIPVPEGLQPLSVSLSEARNAHLMLRYRDGLWPGKDEGPGCPGP